MLIGTNTVAQIHNQLARDYMNGPDHRYKVENMICFGESIVVMFSREYKSSFRKEVVKENRVAVFGMNKDVAVLRNDIIA